jgi:two-component system CheB/CheR fusion protein
MHREERSSRRSLPSAAEQVTAIEKELQLANEELQALQQELQAANEEIESAKEQLRWLSKALEDVWSQWSAGAAKENGGLARLGDALQQIPWPMLLVGRDERIQILNPAAQKLFESPNGSPGSDLEIDGRLSRTLMKDCQKVLRSQNVSMLRRQPMGNRDGQTCDVYLAPVARNSKIQGVLVLFGLPASGAGQDGERTVEKKSMRSLPAQQTPVHAKQKNQRHAGTRKWRASGF